MLLTIWVKAEREGKAVCMCVLIEIIMGTE